MTRPVHLVITDSGLGGLTVCAGIEQAVRQQPAGPALRITYVNAWPDERHGYNDLPDMPAQAAVFDRALAAIEALSPDEVLIACNTLSIVYEHTAHRQRSGVAVQGIVDAGVDLFEAALHHQPSAAIVLIGTRTTIDSGVHVAALRRRGVAAGRIASASCHGLATAIEGDPAGRQTATLIDTCVGRAAAVAPGGDPLYVGLCCTHYGLVADRIEAAFAAGAGRRAVALDPNRSLVDRFVAHLSPGDGGPVSVSVVSKVTIADAKRDNVARAIGGVSPSTAAALRAYVHVPALF